MGFNPLKLPLIYDDPSSLSNTSTWVDHIPFAFAIVVLARPSVLVELGTHKGDSYLAFCQAVLKLGLNAQCSAVDTWKGDEHLGAYDENVFASMRAGHDPLYSGFSRLLRMTFDAAAPMFADGSIDLLHIDGLHTYEAVRHDYETWLPKLSPRAVVLFHDTEVRDRGFGVYRWFEEISAGRPSFNFLHGSGLGILAPGANPPKEVLEFLEAANADPEGMRLFFQTLGHRIQFLRLNLVNLSAIARSQVKVNAALRQAGLPADARSEDLRVGMSNPVMFVDHHVHCVDQLLKPRASFTVGPAGG